MTNNNSSEEEKIKVLMIGPDQKCHGGISFIITQYVDGGLRDGLDLKLVISYSDGNFLKKFYIFISSLVKFIFALSGKQREIIHIHVSKNGSFYRKFVFFLIARALKKRIIVHVHSSDFERFIKRNAINKVLFAYMLKNANLIIVLSQLWKDKIRSIAPEGKS